MRRRHDRALAQGAAEEFRAELKMLPTHGRGYYRARALLGLAAALSEAREYEDADAALSDAAELARGIGVTRVLAEVFRAQARLEIARSRSS